MSAKHYAMGGLIIAAMLALGWHFHLREKQGGESAVNSQPHRIVLKWGGSKDAVRFNIYRRWYPSGKFAKVGSSDTASYTDASVEPGKRYCYVVTSLDAKAQESAPSREMCETVPVTGKR
jgi:fibronectin type 3 domain-containing protein